MGEFGNPKTCNHLKHGMTSTRVCTWLKSKHKHRDVTGEHDCRGTDRECMMNDDKDAEMAGDVGK